MSETRSRIADRIQTDPGVHFNELVRVLDIAPGQAQYHLRRLMGDGDVVEAALYGRTHYYPPTYDEWERRALALLHRETAGDVVADLMQHGPSRPDDVAGRVGIARSTLSWHVSRLVDVGVVEKRRVPQLRLGLARPEATARLLREAHPSLPGRLLDRFTRLVDGLLEE